MPPAAPPPPEVLPPGYTQVKLLGRGQFGRVYEVRGPDGFSSALKVVNNPSKGEVEFLKEFESLTTMRQVRPHPHIVPIQGVWLRTQTGEFISDSDRIDQQTLAHTDLLILMELGQKTLGDRFKEYRREGMPGIPVRELLKYLDGAGKGLDYLNAEIHDLGGGQPSRIIHCDVKPANLLVFGGGMAKVADSGVARVVGAAARATTAGGSPAYAPPELYGRTGPHPTSDQYSLAVTFYELLTGVLPLQAGTALEALLAHANGELDFGKAGANVQAALRRATALQCGNRFETCEEFVEALREAAKADDPAAFPASGGSIPSTSGVIPAPTLQTQTRLGSRGGFQPAPANVQVVKPVPTRTPVSLTLPPCPETDPGTGTGTVLWKTDRFPTPPPAPAAPPSELFETSPIQFPPSARQPADEAEGKAPWETDSDQGTRTAPKWKAEPLRASKSMGVPVPLGPPKGSGSKSPLVVAAGVAAAVVAAGVAYVLTFRKKEPIRPFLQTDAPVRADADSLPMAVYVAVAAAGFVAAGTGYFLLRRLRAALGKTDRTVAGLVDPAAAEVVALDITDEIDCTVFAPPRVSAGGSILVQVFAHLPALADEARRAAEGNDETTKPRGVAQLDLEIRRGDELDIHLVLPGLTVPDPWQKIVWRGRTTSAQFEAHAPPDHPPGTVLGTARVSVRGVPVGHVKFKLDITAPAEGDPPLPPEPTGVDARRYRKVFVSYASADRDEVLKRVQMLRLLKMPLFQDVLNLEPGNKWEAELRRNIDASDLFLLFWSSAARESRWVREELRHALDRKAGADDRPPEILPVVIEGPPPPEPPAELAAHHFNDPLLYYLRPDASAKRR